MAITVTHKFVSPKSEQSDPTIVGPNEWNATHAVVDSAKYVQPSDCVFTPQVPGGTLTAGITNTITLTPVPQGVNGTDTKHPLYISGGTGAAECVTITGGTAVSGAASGTITFVPANNHSGAWTIQSATNGIQEALIYAKANGCNVINRDGVGVWNIYCTITIPAYQNWVIDIQGPVLNYTGTTGDLIAIDSQINSRIMLGTCVAASSNGTCVHLLPTNAPGDPRVTISDTIIFINALAGATAPIASSIGLLIDATIGTITWTTININSIGGFASGVVIPNVAHSVAYNNFNFPHIATNTSGGLVGIAIGANAVANNWWGVGIEGASNASAQGIQTGAQNDNWYGLAIINLPTAGSGVILNAPATNNEFWVRFFSGYYTNNATVSTNRFHTAGMDPSSFASLKLGYAVTTPTVPASGTSVKNTNIWPVIVRFLTTGTSGQYFVIDAAGNNGTTVSITAGVEVYLNPNESIEPGYVTTAPTWQWRAVQ